MKKTWNRPDLLELDVMYTMYGTKDPSKFDSYYSQTENGKPFYGYGGETGEDGTVVPGARIS